MFTCSAVKMYALLVLFLFGYCTEAEKILLLAPSVGSHLLQANSIGEGLIHRGHDVHIILDVNASSLAKRLHPKVKVIYYDLGREVIYNTREYQEPLISMEVENVSLKETFHRFQVIVSMLVDECKLILENQVLFTKLKDEQFDFVVLDALLKCYVIFPHKLGVPYALFTSYLPMDIPHCNLQTPFLMKNPFEGYFGIDRLPRIVATLFKVMFAREAGKGFDLPLFEKYSKVPISELIKETTLWLYDKCRIFDNAVPYSPNVIHVGGLNIREPKQLKDGALKDFVDGATTGFILVSFGSFAKYFPNHAIQTMIDAFEVMPQRIVRKFDKGTLKAGQVMPQNVLMVNWIPQNDLLGHKNIRLFITHAGNNGQHEALYNGVPMLALPLFADQVYNAGEIERRTFGLMLRLKELTAAKLKTKAAQVISNPKYASKIKKASEIFRDEPMSPKETAAYWIDHVIQHGAEHLQSRTNELYWYQILMFDVLFVAILLTSVMCAMVALLCYISYRFCCKTKASDGKLKQS